MMAKENVFCFVLKRNSKIVAKICTFGLLSFLTLKQDTMVKLNWKSRGQKSPDTVPLTFLKVVGQDAGPAWTVSIKEMEKNLNTL